MCCGGTMWRYAMGVCHGGRGCAEGERAISPERCLRPLVSAVGHPREPTTRLLPTAPASSPGW